MPLRIALLTPAPVDSPRGNAVTVARIARGLATRGVDVRVWRADDPSEALAAEARRSAPDLIHAFHAYRAGPAGHALADACEAPLVITLTGTDVSEDLVDARTEPAVRGALRAAAAVTAFHESVAGAVRRAVPEIAGRLAVVAQSVCFPTPGPSGASGPIITGDPCILFPAGIRPVKRPTLPLAPLDALARRHPAMRLWYVGPALDAAELARLEAALAPRPWARYLGAIPHHAMPSLLAAADIVLNCSAAEGGMANAVLEALALGRAVLAADITGNRSLVDDGVTGLLFASESELADQAGRLAGDPELRRRLGEAGQRLVTTRFTPDAELDGYLAVYRRVLAEREPLR